MGKESVQLSVLFTGANGQVGKALQLTLKDVNFAALTRNELDLTNLEVIFDVLIKYYIVGLPLDVQEIKIALVPTR